MRRKRSRWSNYIPSSRYQIYKQALLELPYKSYYGHIWETEKFAIERTRDDGTVEVQRYTWREIARMIINDQLNYLSIYHPNLTDKEIKDFIGHFYPFGEKRNTPYQSWLKERRAILGS